MKKLLAVSAVLLCTLPVDAQDKNSFRIGISYEPGYGYDFLPPGKTIFISFDSDFNKCVRIDGYAIYDEQKKRVYQHKDDFIILPQPKLSPHADLDWNQTDSKGKPVPEGIYTIKTNVYSLLPKEPKKKIAVVERAILITSKLKVELFRSQNARIPSTLSVTVKNEMGHALKLGKVSLFRWSPIQHSAAHSLNSSPMFLAQGQSATFVCEEVGLPVERRDRKAYDLVADVGIGRVMRGSVFRGFIVEANHQVKKVQN